MKTSNKLAIFLLGPPGAGKGTQADLLAKKLKLMQIDSGEIVRSHLDDAETKKIYEAGKLIEPKIMYGWVKNKIKELNQSFIFSGAMRTLYEAKKIVPFLEKNNYQVLVFNIDISPQESLTRNTKRARDIADKPERIKDRLRVYEKQTKPVLKFLKNKVININGQQNIQEVHKDICNAFRRETASTDNAGACASCQAKCMFAGHKQLS